MAGYYRIFCQSLYCNCSSYQLTEKTRTSYLDISMSKSFGQGKSNFVVHLQSLVHLTLTSSLKLCVDASGIGAGVVLQQEDDQGINHSISYFFKKVWGHLKEILFYDREGNSSFTVGPQALLYLFEHDCTTSPSSYTVYTDHNPIVFINKIKRVKNQSKEQKQYYKVKVSCKGSHHFALGISNNVFSSFDIP